MRKLILPLLLAILLISSPAERPTVWAQGEGRRRVNTPYFGDEINWAEASIFWFGKIDPPDGTPGKNYADVRTAYTAEKLSIFVNVEDYYLWYDRDETQTSDLTDYEAVAIYLDTGHDGATSPQPDDYAFISAMCLYGCDDGSRHRREGRGSGSGWDMTWTGDWTSDTWAAWVGNPAYNNNYNEFDYGWWSYIHIPWSTLGLPGPPPQGTVWGLGVLLYDRDDQPPAGYVAAEHWPESFDSDNPSSWGELAFGLATYTPQLALPQGTTVIRRGLGNGAVEDTWVGGGGDCSGGHEGDPEHDNYGGHADLYVENQSLIADLTCFSKSFLRFHLDDIPVGKAIISATLTLHHWSNARSDLAQPSLIWLLTVDGNWGEYTLTWNNAPLVRENLTATWVEVITPENNPGWPGVRYDWDATQAVAEAYAAAEPVNIAMYTADVNFHSSKYFKSSETGDWNEVARPTLTVVWGQPLATVQKDVWPITSAEGQTITYTLALLGSGQAITLTDDLPAEVSAPGSIGVSGGPAASYEPGAHRLSWNGSPDAGQPVTITFPVTIQVGGPLAVFNTAVLTGAGGEFSSDTALFLVDAYQVWLPLVMRNR